MDDGTTSRPQRRFAEESKYSATQFEHNYPEGIENLYWTDARNMLIHRALVQRGLHRSKVLEIGCGKGVVVRYLRDRGVDCHGCELAAIDVYEGLAPYVHTGVDALELPEELRRSFDVVALFDVIEHVSDDAAFLRGIAERFASASTFMITVPSRAEIWSNYDEYYGHQRRYDLAMVERAARDAGLRVVEQRYVFHSLYAPALVQSQLGADREVVVDKLIPKSRAQRAVHRAMARFLVAESTLLPGRAPGTTILAFLSR